MHVICKVLSRQLVNMWHISLKNRTEESKSKCVYCRKLVSNICATKEDLGPASFTKGDASECSRGIQDALFDVLKPPDVAHLL